MHSTLNFPVYIIVWFCRKCHPHPISKNIDSVYNNLKLQNHFPNLSNMCTIKTCNECSLAKAIHHLSTWYWKARRGYIEQGYNSATNNDNNNIGWEKGVSFRSWFRLMFLSWLTCHLQPINNRGTKFWTQSWKQWTRNHRQKRSLYALFLSGPHLTSYI